jgi:hypothetical protein
MLPSHNSGSSLLNQETTITGPRVEGTYIHHQANQQKNMKGKTQRNTNMFFDLLQPKAQKKKKTKIVVQSITQAWAGIFQLQYSSNK